MVVVQRDSMPVLLICLMLVGLGLVMVYSSSSVLASVRFGDASLFLKRQFVRALLGIVIMLVLAQVPLYWWARLARPMMLVAFVLLLLVLEWGQGPAQRWLVLPAAVSGVSFQPAEFAKLALVLYLADVLVRKREEIHRFRRGLLPRLLVVGLVLVLIALQPDLGTAIALGLIALVMLWVGGVRAQHLFGAGLAALLGIGLSLMSSSYQMRRLLSFIDPEGDPAGSYQSLQALFGLGSGGIWGVGVGNSMQKEQYLPEPHTDFVFAFVGEELGLWGTLMVIGLFVALAIYGLQIGRDSGDAHGFLVATGITAMVSVYALLNIAVVTGVLPTTGLPLPFISYGGSSLVWNMAGIGILLGVARSAAARTKAPTRAGGLVKERR
jgi:cell division protein FtsW